MADACAQYDIPLVAYSPVGRGFLTGQYTTMEDLEKVPPHYRGWPWFQPDNFKINIQLAQQVQTLAKRKGVTAPQLAISWTKRISSWRKGAPKTIIPIPGATTPDRVHENAVDVDITDEEMAEIDATLDKFPRAGGRYPDIVPINT